jgi:hypothetical protein
LVWPGDMHLYSVVGGVTSHCVKGKVASQMKAGQELTWEIVSI